MESDPTGAATASTDIPTPAPIPTDPPPPTYTLYKPSAVALATFLGSPLAGLVVMAINYRRLGNRRAAWLSLAAGVAFVAALGTAAALLPTEPPRPVYMGFAVGSLMAMSAIADSLQGRAVKQHARRGGSVASLWKAAGIAILTILVGGAAFLATAFGVLYIVGSDLDQKIDYARSEEVYYAGQATPADARKLGDVLAAAGFFGSDNPKSVVLRTDNTGTTVSFVLGRSWDDPAIVATYRNLTHQIATAGFRTPVTIKLCDSEMTPKRTIPAD